MPDFSEKDVIQRITELRLQYAGKRGKSRFASAIGISPSTYSYYEQDRLAPIPVLLKICQLCGVDIHWLLTGEKSADSPHHIAMAGKLEQKIESLIQTNPSNAGAIEAFINFLEEKTQIEAQSRQISSATTNHSRLIPIIGRTAAGMLGFWDQTGSPESKNMETHLEELVERHINTPIINTFSGQLSLDLQTKEAIESISDANISLIQKSGTESDEITQFLDFAAIQKAFPDCFALQIDGDSMSPRIEDGDIVILSASKPAVQGQTAVVRVADAIGVTCKIIRKSGEKIHLIPINERYETKITDSDKLVWALAVLCHVKVKGRNIRSHSSSQNQ